jgi:integrase
MSVWKTASGTYTTKFWKDGLQYKREGFRTRAEALAWQEQKRKALCVQALRTHSIFLVELATRYLEHCRARMQTNTWRSKRHYFSRLMEYLNDPLTTADSLTRINLLDYLETIQATSGNKAANRHLRDIKALFNWALEHDLANHNPAKNIKPFPESKTVRYVPPAEDIDKLLLCADQEDMDLLVVLYHTGGRIGEVFRLSWDDVNFEKQWVRLWTRKRRSGELEPDLLAMSETLQQVLRRKWETRDKQSQWVFTMKDGSPLSYASKRNLMRDLCRRSRVKPFGFHSIRHHVASIIQDSGKATLGQIQKFLRHRRQSTTEGYLHELTRDQREVATILDAESNRTDRTGQRTG